MPAGYREGRIEAGAIRGQALADFTPTSGGVHLLRTHLLNDPYSAMIGTVDNRNGT